MCWTLFDELQVAADVLLIWPWHQQLCTHWNTHLKLRCLFTAVSMEHIFTNCKLIWCITFPHHPCNLPRNVSFWDGCGRRLPVTGWRIVTLKALYSGVLLFHRIGCLVRGCGSRLYLSLGSSGWGVGFDGCDDDLLKFLQGVPDVPAFEDILWKMAMFKIAESYPKKNLINMRDCLLTFSRDLRTLCRSLSFWMLRAILCRAPLVTFCKIYSQNS